MSTAWISSPLAARTPGSLFRKFSQLFRQVLSELRNKNGHEMGGSPIGEAAHFEGMNRRNQFVSFEIIR